MKLYFEFIKNIKSLLKIDNIGRVLKYIKLFGLQVTYHEFKRKLLDDGYLSYKNIKSLPLKKPFISSGELISSSLTISVIIPTKDAGAELATLLSILNNQKGFKKIEIIVVDSGSTDHTLEVCSDFGTKIVKISPKDFTHSYSRNIGAKHASGDYVLFTVQDAFPTHITWLLELFNILNETGVAAVSCTEIPRNDADLFYRAINWNHNLFMEVGEHGKIMTKPQNENHISLKKNAQLNNIACLISKDMFSKYLFRYEYAEDLDLGIRLIRDGYKLALCNHPNIIHSHNRSSYYHLRRGYLEQIYHSKIFPDLPGISNNIEQTLIDIMFIYQALNSLVFIELESFKIPCKVSFLSRFFIHKLDNPVKLVSYKLKKMPINIYLDDDFKSFIEYIYTATSSSNNIFNYNCFLLKTIRSYIMIIFEFIDNHYDNITDEVFEDFKSSIFKAYALVSGKYLGSCFTNMDSAQNNEYMQRINNQLRQNI